MKNQYFGDVKDYLTYGLLRTLVGASGLRIGVAWMLTADAPNGEGEQRQYLADPRAWRGHDPVLFDLLGKVPEHRRSLFFAERFELIPGGRYFDDLLPEGAPARRGYFERLFAALQGCELLFFDPDVGLETKTCPRSGRRSVKHLYWDELSAAFQVYGHSLLIFQHFPRQSRAQFLDEQAGAYARRLGAERVSWFQTAQVAFFLIARPEHAAALETANAAVGAQWSPRIRPGVWPTMPSSAASTGLNLTLLPGRLAVCRLDTAAPLPAWAGGPLTAVTRTPDELSVVCAQERVPAGVQAETGWQALKVAGPLDFGLTGILAALAGPLARAGISIFALSTYDTDYLLVKENRLDAAVRTLHAAGHHVQSENQPEQP